MKNRIDIEKIGEIEKSGFEIRKSIIVAIVLTFFWGFCSYNYLNLNFVGYVSNLKNIIEIMILPLFTAFVFIIHELFHILFFKLFGGKKSQIKIVKNEALKAIMIHQINEDVFYSKIELIIVLLTPLFLINGGLLLLFNVVNYPYLLFMAIIFNTMGSSIDFCLSLHILFKYQKNVLFNFNKSELIINVYQI